MRTYRFGMFCGEVDDEPRADVLCVLDAEVQFAEMRDEAGVALGRWPHPLHKLVRDDCILGQYLQRVGYV